MSDELIVICMPVGVCASPIAGSFPRVCSRCGAAIWLSPATATRLDGPYALLCLPCALLLCDIQVMPVTDAEIGAAINHIMRGGA